MCGILGYLSSKNLESGFRDRFAEALSYLKFRGPDYSDSQYLDHLKNQIVFGHTRLSIIDLEPNANQPFQSCSKKSIITFNGEIYNYQSIKMKLLREGVEFKTNSDTEVIVNAYEQWGVEEMLKEVDGMFAFGIYDFSKGVLVLARDRFGKKPLYYHHTNNRFIFGSDIRSLKKLLPEAPTLNLFAFGYYLAELTTPEEKSIWNEIDKLKPGHYATITLGQGNYSFTATPYWQLQFTSNCNLSYEEITENSDLLLSQSVKKRLVADVRVSALLSGGLDSSLVVAKMAENSAEKINTYSVVSTNRLHDESEFSNLVARKFDTNHTQLSVTASSLTDIETLIEEYGEPFADSSMIPTYLICKEVGRREKVVLGGDGGDEFFGGYDSYYRAHKLNDIAKFRWLGSFAGIFEKIYPSYRTRLFSDLVSKANSPQHQLLNRDFSFSTEEIRILTNNKCTSEAQNKEHKRIFDELNLQDVSALTFVMNSSLRTRLLNDYLVKVDRASMYASLEMRSPFLDKDLGVFAATLKPNQIFWHGEPKAILKSIAKKYFNDDFIFRKKKGFSIPIDEWFKNDLNKDLKEKLLQPNPLISLDLSLIEKLIIEHETGKVNHVNKLWALYVFNIWSHLQ